MIDWSKAPEGATHYDPKESVWYSQSVGHWVYFVSDLNEWRYACEYGEFPSHEAQLVPAPQSTMHTPEKPTAALDVQVGGGHYKSFAIQPVEFIQRNKLGFCEGNAIKYLCRHKEKGGAEDIKKVIHYCELLLQLEYGQ
jgi:hypothetical protein